MVRVPASRRVPRTCFAMGAWLRWTVIGVLMVGVVGRASATEPSPPPPYQVGIALGAHSYSSASGLGRYANDGPDNAPPLFAPMIATRLSRTLWGSLVRRRGSGLDSHAHP